jgi:hypothetical protein
VRYDRQVVCCPSKGDEIVPKTCAFSRENEWVKVPNTFLSTAQAKSGRRTDEPFAGPNWVRMTHTMAKGTSIFGQ